MDIPVQIEGKEFIRKGNPRFRRDFSIRNGELYNISVHSIPLRVLCLEGIVWITRENDRGDYVLQRCQHVVFETGGLIVIQALTNGRFRITSEN